MATLEIRQKVLLDKIAREEAYLDALSRVSARVGDNKFAEIHTRALDMQERVMTRISGLWDRALRGADDAQAHMALEYLSNKVR